MCIIYGITIIIYYILVIILYTLLYIKKEQKQTGKEGQKRKRNGRERNRAKDAAAILASSSPLFCSVCCPHRPHHRQPFKRSHHKQRRGKSGQPARLWWDAIATTSPPLRHRSTSNQTGSTAGRLSSCQPRIFHYVRL